MEAWIQAQLGSPTIGTPYKKLRTLLPARGLSRDYWHVFGLIWIDPSLDFQNFPSLLHSVLFDFSST
jgi:hypothetical protein